MKIGIIGGTKAAVECAYYFQALGAHVCLFDDGLSPEDLERPVELKKAQVKRVQKRFLAPGEEIEGKSRMHDLFRLIYTVNPEENVLKRMEENPEVFEKLGEQVLDSLKNHMEAFVDLDFVIDGRAGVIPLSMGPGGECALNENSVPLLEQMAYGKECFTHELDKNAKTVSLVGDSLDALRKLVSLKDFLVSGGEINFVLGSGQSLVQAKGEDPELEQEARSLIDEYVNQWKQKCEEVSVEIQKWRDLPDFERGKVSAPVMPLPQLKVYQDYQVTSVDALLDQKSLFLTLELAPWKNLDNSKQELVTVGQNFVYVLTGYRKDASMTRGLRLDEPGFYDLEFIAGNCFTDRFQEIERDMMTYFSRA